MSKLEKTKIEIAIDKAMEYGNDCRPDAFLRFPWQLSENWKKRSKFPSCNKTSLGEFVHTILVNGGDVYQFFCLSPTDSRATVFPMVKLTVDAKIKIESETKYIFVAPTKVKLN